MQQIVSILTWPVVRTTYIATMLPYTHFHMWTRVATSLRVTYFICNSLYVGLVVTRINVL